MREQAIIIYLATESCNSECSHFTTGLPNLATSLSLSRRRIKKEGERGKGELIDAWAERRRRGPIRARPIEKEGDRNCDLHNFYPELRVPLINERLEIGVERAKFKIVSSSLPRQSFAAPSLSHSLIAPLEALHSGRRRPSFCGR